MSLSGEPLDRAALQRPLKWHERDWLLLLLSAAAVTLVATVLGFMWWGLRATTRLLYGAR